MRRLRRTTALLTSLLLLHLGSAGAATACPMGEEATAAAHHHDSAPTQPVHHHAGDSSHCATPCSPTGCTALDHCGSASLSDGARDASAFRLAAGTIVATRVFAPRSIARAPEPPPPRA